MKETNNRQEVREAIAAADMAIMSLERARKELDSARRWGLWDIFGIRQSGDMEFKLADIFTDANLLKTVSEEVDLLLAKDPGLLASEHEELKRRLDVYLERSYEKLNL